MNEFRPVANQSAAVQPHCTEVVVCYPAREMVVSKATSVYVIMVVILMGGLWLILAMGSTLIPPTDLAGKWELTGDAGPQDLWVEQSGKFVNLVMGSWTANLKIQNDGNRNPAQPAGILVSGKSQSLNFEGLAINDQCTIRFTGSITGTYHARRVYKAFR